MDNNIDTSSSGAALERAAADLPNGAYPLPHIGTAVQPRREHFRRLAEAGFRTVVDLRAAGESRGFDEAAAAHDAGLAYENIPVTAQTLGDAQFDRVRSLLTRSGTRPVLVHCASANRVGAVLIPYLLLDEGRTAGEAIEIAQRAGLRSQELAAAALRYARARGATGL